MKELEESDAEPEEIKDRISNINELISKVVAYEQKVEEEKAVRAKREQIEEKKKVLEETKDNFKGKKYVVFNYFNYRSIDKIFCC